MRASAFIISNCVINPSAAKKERVIAEAFRVVKPGGRFAVSDMVFLGDRSRILAEVIRSAELWSGCVSGALAKAEYERRVSRCDLRTSVRRSVDFTSVCPASARAMVLGLRAA